MVDTNRVHPKGARAAQAVVAAGRQLPVDSIPHRFAHFLPQMKALTTALGVRTNRRFGVDVGVHRGNRSRRRIALPLGKLLLTLPPIMPTSTKSRTVTGNSGY